MRVVEMEGQCDESNSAHGNSADASIADVSEHLGS
jgi:hypothetical protein